MRRVARQLVGAFTVDLDGERTRGLVDHDLVPQLERRSSGVERRPEVRGRCGCDDVQAHNTSSTAARFASTAIAACETSTAPVSLSPWPVRMQTAVPPSPGP